MRLASLARKIKATPTKIAEIAKSQEIELDRGSNTKLSEEQIQLILSELGVELVLEKEEIEIKTEEKQIEVSELALKEHAEKTDATKKAIEKDIDSYDTLPILNATEPVANAIDEIAALDPDIIDEQAERPEKIMAHSSEENGEELENTTESIQEATEVIKPPKIHLQGLTVKGKIDLPEPKPKEEKKIEEKKEKKGDNIGPDGIIYTRGPKREHRSKNKRNKQHRKKKDPNFNPIEAERKKKAREEEREKQQRLKAQKKAKARHYEQIVKKKKPIPRKVEYPVKPKVNDETLKNNEAVPNRSSKQKKEKKGVLAKFWQWMNT